MSGKELAERPTTDILDKDAEKLQKFIEAGAPGIGDVDQPKIQKMFDMYLNGKDYTAISSIMHVQKPIVMYLSHKLKWFESKQEYLINYETHNKQKIIEAKLRSQDFLLNALHVMQKKMSAALNRYLATDNEEFLMQISDKRLATMLKIMERLESSIATPSEGKGPLISLNVGASTITRTGENEIEVTPKENAQKNMLKHLAELEREKDKK